MPDAIYQYSFLPFAEVTLGVNYLGMATHFLEVAAEIFERKNYRKLVNKKNELWKEFKKQREMFYAVIFDSWKETVQEGAMSQTSQQQVGKESRSLAKKSLSACFSLYPYCGMEGANTKSELNRVWRDLLTASQHELLFPRD